ncbi:eukaryotic cytochrome b561-domain-containing protein [Alternaria rosae]|uniref:eukaryotic cytochrome b561-domain-containing protein n=1 Tax=Alternaria rosae TaxID=1187941 RepID=UPI001E8DA722|nr:eukaryotic cytochrome b561-domain-containing protein [Alternaria rosae]KAH6865186.1 eukaryotic cytochrome b561-domain-containing protein [Alternaria rosae]
MASATGIPPNAAAARGQSEQEPLLGRRGDASQMHGQPLYHNLWIGTAPIAQAGIWILAAIIWGAIFSNKLIFFSAHPLLNSAGFLLAIQAALVLQPTHTPEQKRSGTLAHFLFHAVGATALTAGLIIIEMNKAGPGHEHFESAHARLGLTFYILVYIQAIVGFTQYYVPQLYGSVDNAKSIYKYHRMSGYVIAVLGLATICAATWTTYNLNLAHIQHWAVIVASVLVLVGVVPRIRLSKFGLKREEGEVRLQ